MNFEQFTRNLALEEDRILQDAIQRLEKKHNVTRRFLNSVVLSSLDTRSKIIFIDRFLLILERLETKRNRFSHASTITNLVVTIASLMTPALLSIRAGNEEIIYYLTWGCALSTALASGIGQLFQVHKKHMLFARTLEKLTSEGFLFLSSSGHYDNKQSPDDNFVYFCKRIEDIHSEEVSNEWTQHGQRAFSDNKHQNDTKTFVDQLNAQSEMLKAQLHIVDVNPTEEKNNQDSD